MIYYELNKQQDKLLFFYYLNFDVIDKYFILFYDIQKLISNIDSI